jgi:2-polyprenyl-3-methyl-5-hydroxy-6-metoxy-1,4-benzoquinol methylase
MNAQADEATYFELYWRQRFDPAALARRVRTLHRNYAQHLPAAREARIVEIGPGFGEMLRYLSQRGYSNVTALDNDATLVAALGRQGFSGALHVEDASAFLRERAGQYDCVIALHVLEHFEAEAGADLLRAIHTALAPGGKAILEVPNMANFITAPYARWADYTHRHGYTQESLAAALRAAGFDVHACFGVRRAIGSLGEAAAFAVQGFTTALAWALLKANYPGARIIAAPAIGIVGVRSPAGAALASARRQP